MSYMKNPHYIKKGVCFYSIDDNQNGYSLVLNDPLPIFQTEIFNDGTSFYKKGNSRFKLSPARKYKINATVRAILGGEPTVEATLKFKTYSGMNGAYLGEEGAIGFLKSVYSSEDTCSVEAIFIPHEDIDIELCISSITTGCYLSDIGIGTKVIIEELEAYNPIVAGTPYFVLPIGASHFRTANNLQVVGSVQLDINGNDISSRFNSAAISYGRIYEGTTWKLAVKDGDFLRQKGGNGGGVVGATQSDAIRNITGNTWTLDGFNKFMKRGSVSGAFQAHVNGTANIGDGGSDTAYYMSFDASRVVPTAVENRPVNTAGEYWVRVG